MKAIWKDTTIWDRLLIAFLIAASIAGTIYTTTGGQISGQKEIVIKVDNEVVKRIPVNKDTDNTIISFNFNGNTGYVEIADGAVRMLRMPKDICPDGVCSDTGWISSRYEAIVCMPNKIIVTVEESGGTDEIDAIVS